MSGRRRARAATASAAATHRRQPRGAQHRPSISPFTAAAFAVAAIASRAARTSWRRRRRAITRASINAARPRSPARSAARRASSRSSVALRLLLGTNVRLPALRRLAAGAVIARAVPRAPGRGTRSPSRAPALRRPTSASASRALRRRSVASSWLTRARRSSRPAAAPPRPPTPPACAARRSALHRRRLRRHRLARRTCICAITSASISARGRFDSAVFALVGGLAELGAKVRLPALRRLAAGAVRIELRLERLHAIRRLEPWCAHFSASASRARAASVASSRLRRRRLGLRRRLALR